MRIFKTKLFAQWAKRLKLTDVVLKKSVDELLRGQYEANLGGYLYKKRVPIDSRGKKGALRIIIAFKKGQDVFFVYGFRKSVKANISFKELELLKELASDLFSLDRKLLKGKTLIEVL